MRFSDVFRPILSALAALVWITAGCSESIVGPLVTGSPPETSVTAGPPALGSTESTVQFYWTGSDDDGTIAGYYWRISDNGENGVVDVTDTLEHKLPWHFTTAHDSVFSVSAVYPDFAPDGDLPETQRRFWESHTFFIRAVDNSGMVDPTPAHVSFTATTIAPTVRITQPTSNASDTCIEIPTSLPLVWDASDPDGTRKFPESVRYLTMPVGEPGSACITRAAFESGEGPEIDMEDPAWSDWIPFDTSDAPLHEAPIDSWTDRPVGSTWLVVMQARDHAGAVTPVFEWGRNLLLVRTSDTVAPTIIISEDFLGHFAFGNDTAPVRLTAFDQQPVRFSWIAGSAGYATQVAEFRWGLDVVDPHDPTDPGWAVDWGSGPAWSRTNPYTLEAGTRNFILLARDPHGSTTTAEIRIEVIEVPRRAEQRSLLLIDDFPKTGGLEGSELIDAASDRQWREWIQAIGVERFQSSDIVDTIDDPLDLHLLRLVDYRGVIWFVGPGETAMQRTIAPESRDKPRYNWLQTYQAYIGNVLVVGPNAMNSTLEPHNLNFPVVLEGSGGGQLGQDSRFPSGAVPRGQSRYPYTGWCIEAFDQVRPGRLWREAPGKPLRETRCSAIAYAAPNQEFYYSYDVYVYDVPVLRPTSLRASGVAGSTDATELSSIGLPYEEFYNPTYDFQTVSLTPRDCQVPMYLAVARRDVDNQGVFDSPLAEEWINYGLGVQPALVDSILVDGEWVDRCASQGGTLRSDRSSVSLQTIAIASRVFSGNDGMPGTKQNGTLTSSDFLWGFNPLHFESDGVQTALRWMLIDHWALNADF